MPWSHGWAVVKARLEKNPLTQYKHGIKLVDTVWSIWNVLANFDLFGSTESFVLDFLDQWPDRCYSMFAEIRIFTMEETVPLKYGLSLTSSPQNQTVMFPAFHPCNRLEQQPARRRTSALQMPLDPLGSGRRHRYFCHPRSGEVMTKFSDLELFRILHKTKIKQPL